MDKAPPADPDLSLEDVASIRGALDAGLSRDEVLAEAHLSSDAWEAAQSRWLASVADQASRGRLEESLRLVKMVDAFRARAEEKARRAKRPWKEKRAAAPAVAPTKPVAPIPSHEDGPVPRFSATNPISPWVAAPEGTKDKQEAAAQEIGIGTILALPLPPRPRAALPFQQGKQEAAPSAAGDEDEDEIKTGSSTIKLTREVPAGDALPFGKTHGQDLAPALEDPTTAPLPTSDEDDDAETFIETLRLLSGRTPAREPLPFKRAPEPDDEDPERGTRVAKGTAPAREALPFKDKPAPSSAEAMARAQSMTLALYARICADVRVHPDQMDQIRAHHGLDLAAWTALHTLWRTRFDKYPAVRAQWQALVEQSLAGGRR